MYVSWESVWNFRLNSPLQSHSKGNLGTKPHCVGQCVLQCVGDFICGKNVPLWQICCCVTDTMVPPCVLVSRSARCRSVQPPFPSTPQPLCGISTCKYRSVPPPLLSALFPSPALCLCSPPSSLSSFINGPHSFPLTLGMPVCPPQPPALCPHLYSFLWFFLPVPFHRPSIPPSYLPPFAAIPSNLHLSSISLLHLWLHFILLILVFSWRSVCCYFRLLLF